MGPEAATVLAVDDEPYNLDLLDQELGAAGYRVLCAPDGARALEIARREQPDLVLLDVMMRGIDGYETCARLKAAEATRSIPVIFLTALADTFDKVRAFRAGAVDYVTKPFESEELLARVGTHIALRREIEAHGRSRATIRLLVDEGRPGDGAMVGASPAMQRVRDSIARVAATDSTVLVQGETGTGKELAARAIHEQGARRDHPLVKLNCAALPHELVESELFGHEKGAFTGATQQRRGRFELADGGTLFLDEVGELPLEAQAKLLRVLQEREFERVGGSRTLTTDVRVIAATNRDLQAQAAAGTFRADLFYRLNVFQLVLPPLRERREDIPLLLRHFTAKVARKLGTGADTLSASFADQAMRYDWPGNVRELENLVERAMIMGGDADAPFMAPQPVRSIPVARDAPPVNHATLEAVERAHLERVLEGAGWKIEGDNGAAHLLGMHASTLRGRMRKLGIRRGT